MVTAHCALGLYSALDLLVLQTDKLISGPKLSTLKRSYFEGVFTFLTHSPLSVTRFFLFLPPLYSRKNLPLSFTFPPSPPLFLILNNKRLGYFVCRQLVLDNFSQIFPPTMQLPPYLVSGSLKLSASVVH
jgi:hypothetical protein